MLTGLLKEVSTMVHGRILRWDKQALAKWIESEKSKGVDFRELEEALGLSYGAVDWWRTGLVSHLKPSDIQAIAKYRQCSTDEVERWLKLNS